MTSAFLAIACAIFVLAGAVKGLVGIGLPTASMAMLTLVVAPREAIALILMPMLFSNLWQVLREGELARTARRFAPFAVILFVTVAATVLLTRDVDDRVLLGVLGGATLLFVVLSRLDRIPALPPSRDRPAQLGFGLIAGILGGLTSGWAAPLGLYLTMTRVDRAEWIRATGFLIFVGSVPLALAYLAAGLMTIGQLGLSALMLIPTLAGFTLGEAARRRMPVAHFRTLVLVTFAVLGLNLIRRAIWGG